MIHKWLKQVIKTSIVGAMLLSTAGCKLVMFDPAGTVSHSQRNVIITSIILMLSVVIPVIIMTLIFSWKYRASNTRAKYTPEWAHNNWLEFVWWLIPCLIILALAIITWITSHRLDPYRPIPSSEKPLSVQVVSLNWKWLFIYPEQNIATVNYLEIPKGRTIHFKITSDAPMNSFWIPQLGSQIMSMPGMQTQLHLVGNRLGTFKGYSANYSGGGFSGMGFDVRVSSDENFKDWVKQVKNSEKRLSVKDYVLLSAPSRNNPVTYYSRVDNKLFSDIMMQYMKPGEHITALKNEENIVTD